MKRESFRLSAGDAAALARICASWRVKGRAPFLREMSGGAGGNYAQVLTRLCKLGFVRMLGRPKGSPYGRAGAPKPTALGWQVFGEQGPQVSKCQENR